MSDLAKKPAILVIVGITGDLAQRKLLPAICQIQHAGRLPEKFQIIGITRRSLSKEDVLPSGDNEFLSKSLTIRQMDLTDPSAYAELYEDLNKIEESFGEPTQRLFYMSIPPQASQPVIELLGEAGFGKIENTKLLMEKPFGNDLASAEDLIERIHEHFAEENIYRIDHYMAKEMAQNIVVFRAGNSLLKRTWNKDFIESIQITASEEIGIEGRVGFYEQTGALRDLVQSHLLQLAALTLMQLPAWNEMDKIPLQRLMALKSLHPLQDVSTQVTRGQYKGYRDEVENTDSVVETFVSLTLHSDDPRWEGVPITLTTGKALDQKLTEIRITYRQEDAAEANELVLRIQPNEGAEILLWTKQPGYEHELKQLPLDFSYRHHFAGLPEAYERVFVDAIRSDRTLFTTSDEVLASWHLLKPIQDHWNMTDSDLTIYEPGSTPEEIKSKR